MDRYFITFQEARRLLKQHLFSLESVEIPVKEACAYVLAEDLYAPIDLPPFTNSAMDGYAVRFKRGGNNHVFIFRGEEIKAGDSKEIRLREGEAVRVFTGAPVPQNADAVVMLEVTEVRGTQLVVKKKVKRGENIRWKGEEISKGEKVLKKGTLLNPAGVGFLSTLGFKHVRVIRKPRVYGIITGSEIIEPGEKLTEGKVYDANSYSLYSALSHAGVQEIEIRRVGDELDRITREFYRALDFADIVLFSGGISVGDYDFVRDLMEKEKVKTLFYKVRQKPGKPLFVGLKNGKFIFGLPGNTASGLVCFYEYVYPTIRALSGLKNIFLPEAKYVLLKDIKKKTDRLWFLKGKIQGNGVFPLEHQGSHMLSSFAKADALIIAPRNRKWIKRGEKVTLHLLHGNLC